MVQLFIVKIPGSGVNQRIISDTLDRNTAFYDPLRVNKGPKLIRRPMRHQSRPNTVLWNDFCHIKNLKPPTPSP